MVTAGGYLSDPGQPPARLPRAVDADARGGGHATRAAGLAGGAPTLRATLDALSAVVAPDGAADYLGRGQGNVWVPAATVAAMVAGATLHPERAARYLGVARVALARLRALHLTSDRGLLVVPGARVGYDGIDPYVHTVAYNGLALWALAVAAERAAALGRAPGTPATGACATPTVRAPGSPSSAPARPGWRSARCGGAATPTCARASGCWR